MEKKIQNAHRHVSASKYKSCGSSGVYSPQYSTLLLIFLVSSSFPILHSPHELQRSLVYSVTGVLAFYIGGEERELAGRGREIKYSPSPNLATSISGFNRFSSILHHKHSYISAQTSFKSLNSAQKHPVALCSLTTLEHTYYQSWKCGACRLPYCSVITLYCGT